MEPRFIRNGRPFGLLEWSDGDGRMLRETEADAAAAVAGSGRAEPENRSSQALPALRRE